MVLIIIIDSFQNSNTPSIVPDHFIIRPTKFRSSESRREYRFDMVLIVLSGNQFAFFRSYVVISPKNVVPTIVPIFNLIPNWGLNIMKSF